MNLNVEDQIATLEEKDAAKEQAGRKMFEALAKILNHVEDMKVERMPPSQCTLCHTFRMIGHEALAAGREAGWGQ